LVLRLRGGMQIFVKILAGDTTTLDVEADQTLGLVKEKIRDQTAIPMGRQRLLFPWGEQLEDCQILSNYNIVDGGSFELHVRLRIVVSTMTSQTITFDVWGDQSVDNIKAKIQNKLDIPPDQQRLVFAWKGEPLEYGCTLSHYNTDKQLTLHLLLHKRMRIFVKIIMGKKHHAPCLGRRHC